MCSTVLSRAKPEACVWVRPSMLASILYFHYYGGFAPPGARLAVRGSVSGEICGALEETDCE